MLIGSTPTDLLEAQRQLLASARIGGSSATQGPSASSSDEGADAQAVARQVVPFDQTVKDKAANIAKAEGGAAGRDPSRRSDGDPTWLTSNGVRQRYAAPPLPGTPATLLSHATSAYNRANGAVHAGNRAEIGISV